MSKLNKTVTYYVAYILKKLWAIAALTLVVVAVALSLLRYSLPYMNDQKHHLEQWISGQVGAQLSIGEISAKWQGLGPAIVLRDVQLLQTAQSPISLNIDETAIEVDFWQSVLARQIQSNKFDLQGMRLALDVDLLGQNDTQYPIIDALENLFLQQLQLFSISGSKIVLNSQNAQQQVVLIDQVSWVNKDQHHQGVGQLQIEEIAKNSASFILDLHGNQESLKGTFYAKGEELDLSPWLQQFVSSEHKLVESRGSFVMWATIQHKALESVQLDLSNSRFAWQRPSTSLPEDQIQASVLGGQINARPIDEDWLFNLNNLTVQINQDVLVSNWRGKIDSAGSLLLEHQQPLKLELVMPLLELGISAEQTLALQSLQPQATLNALSLNRSQDGDLAVQASISELQWQQTQYVPGLTGLISELNWFNGDGRLNLKGKASQLKIDQLLPDNIDYQSVYADLYIHTTSQGFSISSDNALFKSELVSIEPNFAYTSNNQHLAFNARVDALDVARLEELYPAGLMGSGTRDYLVNALLSGQVSGAKLLWNGPLQAFPFENDQGVFQAQVQVQDGQLKFAPQWPALQNFNVDLLFENQGLTMTSQKGRLMDVVLTDLSAKIPSFSDQPTLTIDANAQALGPKVTALMMQSNLADTLGQTLEQIQVSGLLNTDLQLTIPLNGEELTAKGQVYLDNNQLNIPSLNLLLEQATGQLGFVNSTIQVDTLSALLLEQAIDITFKGEQKSQAYETNIGLKGDWQVSPLIESFAPGLDKYLSGTGDWTADIALAFPQQGYQYSAKIVSGLAQIQSELPAPFAKPSGEILPLVFTSQGNQQASSIKINLGEEIEFNGNLPHQDMRFSRAHLAVGESDLIGMGLGFSISANVKELDTAPWYEAIDSLITGIPNSDKPLLEAPKRIFITADNAIIAAQRFTDLEMVAKNTSDSWLLDINAKQARMEVALYKDWLNKGVDINADFIDMVKWHSTSSEDEDTDSQKSLAFTANIDTLPPVNFSCGRCSFLDNDLGKIDFSLSRSATGMKIDNVRFNNSHGLFYGSGDWFLVDGKSSTRLIGEFSSSNFGAFLKGFDVNSGIKDSKASSKFDLSWQRAPYEFNFASLNGNIDWRLSDGSLTEVSDKGSRIFSLLSLDSLVRKLQLDFRDVFAKGFFYDKITGSFQLQNGVADTQDTVVDGGAGEITMQGYTDLTAQQLNYQIEFVPNVTSSLPVIIAYMVNPATALAVLALDQMLTSAKVISNIQWSLTGTLDDPQLTELGRDSKEVTLPAKVQPKDNSQPIIDELDQPVSLVLPAGQSISG